MGVDGGHFRHFAEVSYGRGFDLEVTESGRRLMRRIAIALAFLFSVLVFVAVGGFVWLRTSLPKTSGTVVLSDLEQPLSIYRDANAIPHIFAKSKRDAYYALGFVHAQDRLWQMDFLRRLGSGRLSEILGERLVGTDKYIRTLGLPHVAAEIFENASPAAKAALTAYADGVNAWLDARSGALPPEFLMLGYEPGAWKPTDPLLWSRLMAIRLGRNAGAERVRLRVAEALAENGLPAKMIQDLWPVAAPVEPTTIAGGLSLPEPPLLKDSGSNGWVVHGDRTASGKPILANDPHLRFGAPILWYLAHIEAPGLRLTGATVPGVPFMILGHNGSVAWGMTNGGGDAEDFFLETVDPDNLNNYMAPTGSRPFETRREVIQVKDASPVVFTVRRTRHGPVLSDLVASQPEGAKVAAMATPALRGDDRTIEAILGINSARDWKAFETAARDFHTPHTNLFFASVNGDIGFVSSGRIPQRKAGNGFSPELGADGNYDWKGFIPMTDMPRAFNPEAGWIANANNRIVGPDYPYFITRNWGPPYRARRIAEILKQQATHGVAESQALQRDTLSTAARELLPLMLNFPVKDPRLRKAVALLMSWNHEMKRDRPEPLIYATWQRHLAQALIADELGGPKAREFQRLVHRPGARFLTLALTERKRWCDDIRTDKPESCQDQLAGSLTSALDELTTALGPSISDWRWGDMHRAVFAHPVLSHVPVIAKLSDLSIESDGGDHTVNRGMTAGQGHPVPPTHLDGAGYRAIYDLGDLENSRFMIATGQSGNILSSYYRSFLTRWRDGEYIKIPGNRGVLLKMDASHLRLTPK